VSSRRSNSPSIALALSLLLSAVAAQPASAQTGEPEAEPAAKESTVDQARETYQRATAAHEAGRHQEAIELFQEADRLLPRPALSYNIALVYEDMKDGAKALAAYRSYLERDPNAEERAQVEARIHELEKEFEASALQMLSVTSDPVGATVLVDGKPVGVTPWSANIEPGAHDVELRMQGFANATRSVELTEEAGLDVSIALAPMSEVDTADAGPGFISKVEPLTWGVLGLGLVSFGVAVGFEFAGASAEDQARQAATQVEAADQADTMTTDRTIARIFTGVGAAAIVAGGVLFVIDVTSEDESAPEAQGFLRGSRVAAGCLGGGCGLSWAGEF